MYVVDDLFHPYFLGYIVVFVLYLEITSVTVIRIFG